MKLTLSIILFAIAACGLASADTIEVTLKGTESGYSETAPYWGSIVQEGNAPFTATFTFDNSLSSASGTGSSAIYNTTAGTFTFTLPDIQYSGSGVSIDVSSNASGQYGYEFASYGFNHSGGLDLTLDSYLLSSSTSVAPNVSLESVSNQQFSIFNDKSTIELFGNYVFGSGQNVTLSGNITSFSVEDLTSSAPEPSTSMLFLIGIVLLASFAIQRRHKVRKVSTRLQ